MHFSKNKTFFFPVKHPGWVQKRFAQKLDNWKAFPIKSIVSRENFVLSLTASGDISSVFRSALNVPRKIYNSLRKIENLFFLLTRNEILHKAQKKGYSKKLFVIDIGRTQNGKSNK